MIPRAVRTPRQQRSLPQGISSMALLFSFFALLLGTPVHAFTIQPPSFFYELAPSEEATGIVRIQNDTDYEVTYRPLLQDVTSVDEDGTPIFFDEGVVTPTSLVSWLEFETVEITLVAGESRDLPFTIRVPSEGAFGGYYGALLFSSFQGKDENQIETRVGTLLVLSVAESPRSVEIDSFYVEHSWFQHLPVTFVTRLRNDGQSPAQPTGTITITNMLGSTTSVLTFNESGAHIFPGTVRRLQSTWQRIEVPAEANEIIKEWKNFGFGYYTAWLSLTGEGGEAKIASLNFWVIPWQIILGFGLTLSVIVFLCRPRVS